MGNCAGCAAPKRTYRVQRLQQNSPIKNRLSNSKGYYQPPSNNNSNIKQFSLTAQKDKIVQRGSYNQNMMGSNQTDFFGNVGSMMHSKSKPANNNTYNANNVVNDPFYNDFNTNLLSQVVRTHIKLYPDNPENLRDTNKKLERSYLYQNDNDMYNSKLDYSRKESSGNAYSNQLLKSVQSQSKKYLHDLMNQDKNNFKAGEQPWSGNQSKPFNRSPVRSPRNNNYHQHNMPRFDDISQIRTQKQSRNHYEHQNSLPLKKYNRYNKDLTVIEQILQQDHKTPMDIRLQRKKNGEDVIYDGFQGFPDQIQPLQIPNLEPYLSSLKLVTQKS